MPEQYGHNCQSQLRQQACGHNGHPTAPVPDLPAFRGIGVEHGEKNKKGHPHGGHPDPVAFCRIGVSQLVDHLGQEDSQAIVHQPLETEKMNKAVGERLPLPQGQKKPQAACQGQHNQKRPGHEQPDRRQGGGEKGIGMEQGDADKKVVGDEPFKGSRGPLCLNGPAKDSGCSDLPGS